MSRLGLPRIEGRSSGNRELNRNPKVRPTSRCPALDPATTLENPDSAPCVRARRTPTASTPSPMRPDRESGLCSHSEASSAGKERIRPTLKMSHGGSGRDSCRLRVCRTGLHSRISTEARGVTAPDVGSGDWLGHFLHWRNKYRCQGITFSELRTISETASPRRFPESAGAASPPARKLRLLT
jgi:hypothetical protein